MNFPRAGHTATLLADGTVLVTGGQSGLNIFPIDTLDSVELYHPTTNTWTKERVMAVPRSGHAAVLLPDGRVLVVGGSYLPPPGAPAAPPESDQAEIYDPARRYQAPWSFAGQGLPALNQQAVAVLSNGTVLVIGGADSEGLATAAVEQFDPAGNRWKPTRWPMARARYGQTASTLLDGRILVVGGYTTQAIATGGSPFSSPQFSTWCGIFDLKGNNADPTAQTKLPRIEHTATVLRNGMVLVVGSAYASNADSELYDPASGEWLSTGMRMDRYLHTATLLKDGRVLIAGGFGIGSQRTAWIYSQPTTKASLLQPASPPMMAVAALLLVGLITIGLVLTSGRLPPMGSRRRIEEAEWIEP
jgi:hypothetical protein